MMKIMNNCLVVIRNNKYAECLEQCLLHSDCLLSQNYDNSDSDNDDGGSEHTDDCDDDPKMKRIIIIRKESEDVRVPGPNMLQLTSCVCLKIKKGSLEFTALKTFVLP